MIETDPKWQEFHDLARRMTALSNRRIDALLNAHLEQDAETKSALVRELAAKWGVPIVEITIPENTPADAVGYITPLVSRKGPSNGP